MVNVRVVWRRKLGLLRQAKLSSFALIHDPERALITHGWKPCRAVDVCSVSGYRSIGAVVGETALPETQVEAHLGGIARHKRSLHRVNPISPRRIVEHDC